MAEQTPGEHHQRLPSRMDYERITKTTRILQDFDALRAYFQRTERGHTCAQCGYSTMNLANLLFHVLVSLELTSLHLNHHHHPQSVVCSRERMALF